MELTEVEKTEKNAIQWLHCTHNTLIPFEYEWTCFSCGYNVIEGKMKLQKTTKKFNQQTELCWKKLYVYV